MAEKILLSEFVKKLLIALNNGNIQYMLIGGVAAMYYGRSRSTMDCDISLSITEKELKKLYDCLKNNGFQVRDYDITEGYKDKTHFNAYLPDHPFRADFSWGKSSLELAGFKRAKQKEIFGIKAWMEEPEDIIIAKLVYGSQQDLDDALAILLEQKTLDMKYLQKRAIEENVEKNLEELIRESKK
ncbi:hypothetical protein HY988_05650 [Candidatus Micrarchaeota archaeon]|nr:hypothetical protein [Candidatus Micrarchaeota archaeon]